MHHKNQTVQGKQKGRIHPLMATAAVAVTVVSLVGVAALTGMFPNSYGTNGSNVGNNGQTAMMANGSLDNRGAAEMNTARTQSPDYAPLPTPKPMYPAASSSNNNNGTQSYAQQDTQVAQAPAICHSCGRVESVVAVQQAVAPSGIGIAAGAVLGGVLGNQVGGGNGRTLATVAGAVAGGYGGNEVERRTRTTTQYQVRVRMEDGKLRTFPQSGQDGWRNGDRVRVVNGALTSRG